MTITRLIVGNVDGVTRLFKTAEGTDVLPSAIYSDQRGHRFVGGKAFDRSLISPDAVAQGFKRLMGTSSRVKFGPLDWSPEECSAEILRTLQAQARTEAGDFNLEGAIITTPAAFNQMQSEATFRAARLAGMDRVSLLQEPVAAALASVANSRETSGNFLIYDIGGGTFDAALVQSSGGVVTVVAHEGVNMLGGRDFDRLIYDHLVKEWLLENFALPPDYQTRPEYRRLNGVARHAVERAKIDLATMQTTLVHAADDEVRTPDAEGQDIYLSIDLARTRIETLFEGRIAETVALCRSMLERNNMAPDDLARVVLIGGPSKMPIIRDMVPHELGVAAEPNLDPMTAVAQGAAIFAAGRDWNKVEGSTARQSRQLAQSGEAVKLDLDYPASSVEENFVIRARCSAPGHLLEIVDSDGVSTGKVPLDGTVKLDLRLARLGRNGFAVRVTDDTGRQLPGILDRFDVERHAAAARGIPMSFALAVKVQDGTVNETRNTLTTIIPKGVPLPAEGSSRVRTGRTLRPGSGEPIRVELFQQTASVAEPRLALPIGIFLLDPERHLDTQDFIPAKSELILHCKVQDSGLIHFTVEVPAIGRTIEAENFYVPGAAAENFDGREGYDLVHSILETVSQEVAVSESLLSADSQSQRRELERRIEEQGAILATTVDAETNRGVAEELRRIRCDFAELAHRPENRAALLQSEIDQTEERFDLVRRSGQCPSGWCRRPRAEPRRSAA
ncbi:Hsp70 family protein, partial [Paracoccus sp. Z118]|uniref:Hsp70 family protein n=1 Tax=Paracoccus sp. Z118 TaxID=2851017 RepID=UPI001C2CC5CD